MKLSSLLPLAAVVLAGCAAPKAEQSGAAEARSRADSECRAEAHIAPQPRAPMPYGTQSESPSGVTAEDVRDVRVTDEFQKCMQRKGFAQR